MRQQTIRRNVGPATISYWRLDMLNFHNMQHNKYRILGHRILAYAAGWLPPRLAEEVVWTFQWGSGQNIEMDMANEFMNKEFKEFKGKTFL